MRMLNENESTKVTDEVNQEDTAPFQEDTKLLEQSDLSIQDDHIIIECDSAEVMERWKELLSKEAYLRVNPGLEPRDEHKVRYFCEACGNTVNYEDKHCRWCGERLDWRGLQLGEGQGKLERLAEGSQ
jgi:hypothetical protein